ncbi:cytochrome P450 [Triangularia verruculosa]|uniref:Cytochrome P450 n=1 Tax=Triangularia verruculosa TaxID=2587418 RepID=A0AAN6X9N1_9PEZI|nr:cytochrome P450 [Triangularia verruculosa]
MTPLLLLLILTLLFLTYLLSPLLSRDPIPGPLHARLTSLVIKYHEFTATRTSYIHSLHLRYGPVVRVAPNEVVFASAAAVKEIYCSNGSGYDKTEWYDLFKVYDRRTMFTILGKQEHAKRKRVLADRYANSNIMKGGVMDGIKGRARRFREICERGGREAVDLYIILHAYAFDCVTLHLFHPHSANSLTDPKDSEVMLEVTFDSSLQNRLLSHYSPLLHRLLNSLLSSLLNLKPRETPLADSFVLNTAAETNVSPFTLLHRLHHDLPSSSPDMPQIDKAAECLDHMAAGIDTTGDALCFLIWELSQPSSLPYQRKLQEELRSAGENTPVEKLEYLDAVVMEGLRMFPAIPMSLPRYCPPGGRVIDGHEIPGGTIVSCQAYSVQRLEQGGVFEEPDRFLPERWLDGDEEKDRERRRCFFAFSQGGRGCIGKHLALAEMKCLLREVYSNFTTLPGLKMTEKDMEMADLLVSSRPAGQRCLVRFEKLES